MSYLTRNLRQVATVWAKGAQDGFGGTAFSTPIQIPCFWEDKQLLAIDKDGNQVRAEAVVYLDRDVALGDYLYLGVSNATTPIGLDTAKQVIQFRKIPNIRCTEFERAAYLGTNRSIL